MEYEKFRSGAYMMSEKEYLGVIIHYNKGFLISA